MLAKDSNPTRLLAATIIILKIICAIIFRLLYMYGIKFTRRKWYFFVCYKRRIVKNNVCCVVLVKILMCPACKQTLRTLFPVEINKKNTNYANIIKPLRSENSYGTQNNKEKNVGRVFFSRIKNIYIPWNQIGKPHNSND